MSSEDYNDKHLEKYLETKTNILIQNNSIVCIFELT